MKVASTAGFKAGISSVQQVLLVTLERLTRVDQAGVVGCEQACSVETYVSTAVIRITLSAGCGRLQLVVTGAYYAITCMHAALDMPYESFNDGVSG